jgi:hypothetical protein
MALNTEEEQGALKLAEFIEKTANNPEEAAKRIEAKTGTKGIFGTIFTFIKDYKNKDPNQSEEDWLKQQYAKPEYSAVWKDGEKERNLSAKTIVNSIDDYDNAKKSLQSHIELGGSRASWLATQIEIGAANNNKDPAQYAKEVAAGLKEAMEENSEFLLDTATSKGAK